MVVAKWTGSYPCLCSGRWELTIDGVNFTDVIPPELRTKPMNTFGEYQSWHFENWIEVFESYVDGLPFECWIKENEWVNNLPCNPFEVYLAFNENDWRHGSCGGCI